MSSNTPTIRQIAWISILPQLIIMAAIMLVFYQFNQDKAILYGAITYLIISTSLRILVPASHRKGIELVRKEHFLDAIIYFEKSYRFFKRYEWIDKYRYCTLLSASKISYREMALNNIAFCYGQAGDGTNAKLWYERTLWEFPESGMAKAGLRLLKSVND